jgi:hypothetical protein
MTKEHAQKVEHLKTAISLAWKAHAALNALKIELELGMDDNKDALRHYVNAQADLLLIEDEIKDSNEWLYKD